MSDKNINIIIGLVLALIIIIAGFLSLNQGGSKDKNDVKQLVNDFGKTMQTVSLLGPDASSTLKAAYGVYVMRDLLVMWQQDPKHAPGKLASSPWPDRIDVTSITPQGSGYIVNGDIVYISSTPTATSTTGTSSNTFVAPKHVIVQVIKDESGVWKIAAFEIQMTK